MRETGRYRCQTQRGREGGKETERKLTNRHGGSGALSHTWNPGCYIFQAALPTLEIHSLLICHFEKQIVTGYRIQTIGKELVGQSWLFKMLLEYLYLIQGHLTLYGPLTVAEKKKGDLD